MSNSSLIAAKADFAKLKDVTIHYEYAGEGEAIIFLHGFPEFSYQWRKQLNHFAKTNFVIAPDLRGYNLSSKPEGIEQYTVLKIMEDIKELCEHFHLNKIFLVGHDWGGITAWAFAHFYPQLLKKLIILNAPHPSIYQYQLRTNPAQQKAAEYLLMLRRAMAAKILARNQFDWLNHWVLNNGLSKGLLTEADKEAYHAAWSQPDALNAMLNYYRVSKLNTLDDGSIGWGNFEFMPSVNVDLLKTKVPTLVIWGERDEALVIDNLNGLSDFAENLTVKKLPDCSHLLIQEQPEAINRLIEEFIKN